MAKIFSMVTSCKVLKNITLKDNWNTFPQKQLRRLFDTESVCQDQTNLVKQNLPPKIEETPSFLLGLCQQVCHDILLCDISCFLLCPRFDQHIFSNNV